MANGNLGVLLVIHWAQLAVANPSIQRAFEARGLDPARDKLTVAPVDITQVKTITQSTPHSEETKRDIQAYRAGMAKLAPQFDTWGYRAQMVAQGGQERVESFHARLVKYLRLQPQFATQPEPQALDTKV